jgi:uncharacterized membrane protein YdjX (TVP38/TMEM64 family)
MFNRILRYVWTALAILTFVAVVYFLVKHTYYITQLVYRSGALAPIVALILYPALAPTPITTEPITLVLAVIYGPLFAVAMAVAGNMMSTVVEYYLGVRLGKATNFEEQKEKLPFGLGKMRVDTPAFLIFGRMIPGYGSKVISLLAGMHGVPMKLYLWTSLLTNIGGAVILSYGGYGLIKLIKISMILKTLHL